MFRIKKLDIFIAKQFGLLFVATFFICQFVLMMQFLWRYIDDLIGKGLTMDVMAQFFWYMALMLVPQAFPLAILLSSLITYGNLGESSELTAIKAAGISLLQSMRSLIVIVLLVAGVSIYFQEKIAPDANKNLAQLLVSMKQKSPELEIPEGVFYDGIPNTNLYVQKKDLKTGMLYGMMIYRQTGSYEDQAIILADSGMLQSTAEKKHLLLTMWSGEWFENMKQQDLGGTAQVPYRRETFAHKQVLLDFDGEFNLADASLISGNAKGKSTRQILHDLDSIRHGNDSVGRQFYIEGKRFNFADPVLSREDSIRLAMALQKELPNLDTLYTQLNADGQREVTKTAARQAQMAANDVMIKADYAKVLHRQERMHVIEAIGKFTLALSCVIFFFIGAPLGAIIRKGGLGVPVIISVLVFIVYYIFENSGMRMARDDNWTVWFGKSISTMVLAPLAVFFTYKANNDSAVFNIDAYRLLFRRMLGLRQKRNIMGKEVIINDPDYADMDKTLQQLITTSREYLSTLPRSTFFGYMKYIVRYWFSRREDMQAEGIMQITEYVVEVLSNSKDRYVLRLLNGYPVMETRNFRFYRRRRKDLRAITKYSEQIRKEIEKFIN